MVGPIWQRDGMRVPLWQHEMKSQVWAREENEEGSSQDDSSTRASTTTSTAIGAVALSEFMLQPPVPRHADNKNDDCMSQGSKHASIASRDSGSWRYSTSCEDEPVLQCVAASASSGSDFFHTSLSPVATMPVSSTIVEGTPPQEFVGSWTWWTATTEAALGFALAAQEAKMCFTDLCS